MPRDLKDHCSMRSSSAIVGRSESIWIASVLVVIRFPSFRSSVNHCVYITIARSTVQAFIQHLSRSIVHYVTSACILPRILHIILRSILLNILSCILHIILSSILPNILHIILHSIVVYTIHAFGRAFFHTFFQTLFTPRGMGYPIQPRQLLT